MHKSIFLVHSLLGNPDELPIYVTVDSFHTFTYWESDNSLRVQTNGILLKVKTIYPITCLGVFKGKMCVCGCSVCLRHTVYQVWIRGKAIEK